MALLYKTLCHKFHIQSRQFLHTCGAEVTITSHQRSSSSQQPVPVIVCTYVIALLWSKGYSTSVIGGAHTHCVNSWIVDTFAHCVSAPPLTKVLCYSTVIRSKYVVRFLPGTATYIVHMLSTHTHSVPQCMWVTCFQKQYPEQSVFQSQVHKLLVSVTHKQYIMSEETPLWQHRISMTATFKINTLSNAQTIY